MHPKAAIGKQFAWCREFETRVRYRSENATRPACS
jgi:hypothetical protein